MLRSSASGVMKTSKRASKHVKTCFEKISVFVNISLKYPIALTPDLVWFILHNLVFCFQCSFTKNVVNTLDGDQVNTIDG